MSPCGLALRKWTLSLRQKCVEMIVAGLFVAIRNRSSHRPSWEDGAKKYPQNFEDLAGGVEMRAIEM